MHCPLATVMACLGTLSVVMAQSDESGARGNVVRSLPADTLAADLFDRPLPLGLDARGAGVSDAGARARFDLGRRLFFDPILSSDRTVSCASCHDPRHGFASAEALPRGVSGRRALRNAPTLLNRGPRAPQSWDGSSPDLRHQVTRPIANPREMDLPLPQALARLSGDDGYRKLFESVFAADGGRTAVTKAHLAEALASFVARLHLGDSPVDRFRVAGDRSLLTKAERTGMWIWESKGRCWKCHSGPNFTDEQFHNTGVGAKDGIPESGRMAVTHRSADHGRFKTPTLRGLAFTAPYMHDGSLKTLREVVEFYRRGGVSNENLDPRIEPLDLSEEDVRNLVAFLGALSKRAPGRPSAPRAGRDGNGRSQRNFR